MTDVVSNAEFRAALGSIRYNASNYQVFSFSIAFSFLLGFGILFGVLVGLQGADTNVSSNVLYGLTLVSAILIVVIFIAYTGYLRNIGKYIYGRMRPLSFGKPSKCKAAPTGTSLRSL